MEEQKSTDKSVLAPKKRFENLKSVSRFYITFNLLEQY